MEKIINLTPHPIVIVDAEGKKVKEIPPSGVVARLKARVKPVGEIAGVPITQTIYGEPENLPAPKEGALYEKEFYIVSQLIKNAFPERLDLLVPTEMMRDEKGNIIGCRSLGV